MSHSPAVAAPASTAPDTRRSSAIRPAPYTRRSTPNVRHIVAWWVNVARSMGATVPRPWVSAVAGVVKNLVELGYHTRDIKSGLACATAIARRSATARPGLAAAFTDAIAHEDRRRLEELVFRDASIDAVTRRELRDAIDERVWAAIAGGQL